MSMLKRRVGMSAGLLVALAGLNPVQAEPPAILDRIPANSAVVFVTRDLQASHDQTKQFTKMLESAAPMPDDDNPFEMAEKLLAIPGINKNGSMAFVMAKLPAEDAAEGSEPEAVVLMPVSDFAAAIKHFGGEPGKDIIKIKIENEDTFVKDLGGGLAVISPVEELVRSFEGKSGNLKGHADRMGASGRRIADKASNLLIADIAAMRPMLDEAAQGMKDQGEMMGAMAGEQGAAQAGAAFGMMQGVIESIAKDGQVLLIGLSADDKGILTEMSANFREGTESAAKFSKGGQSGSLISRLPNKPFYFAFAMDLTAPVLKSWVKSLNAADADEAAKTPDMMKAMNIFNENATGTAMLIGANPAALMGGGFLVNTTAFVAGKDSKAMLGSIRESMAKLQDTKMAGTSIKVDYRKDAVEIAGTKVDVSTTTIQPDPNDPDAFQVQMMMGMVFGQGGAIGQMMAPVDSGLVMTMSQNTPLMTDAIEAAKSGNGIAVDEAMKSIQSKFPTDRMFEVYLGSKALMEAIQGAISMFTGENVPVPAELGHVGLAGAADAGSMSFHLYIPNNVIAGAMEMGKAMEAAGGGLEEEDAAPAKDSKPQF